MEKEKSKKVAVFYFPFFNFLFGSASSTRFSNIGYFLKNNGWDVFYIGSNIFEDGYREKETECGTIISVNRKKKTRIEKLLFNRITATQNECFLFSRFPNPDLLFVSSYDPKHYYPKNILKKYSTKTTKVIISIMEHYSLKQFDYPLIQIKQTYFNNKFINKFYSEKAYVMPISTYLSNHFESRGNKSYVVPFVFDKDLIKPAKHLRNEKLFFLYVGVPFKKDDIFTPIEGFLALNKEETSLIDVHLVGVDEKYFLKHGKKKLLNLIKKINFIHLHGRIPYQEVEYYYNIADFTFLMRDPATRTSKAGFPTKVCESLFKGIPVITNSTSDLNKYLINEENSILVKEYSYLAFLDAIRVALKINKKRLAEMKIISRKKAETELSTSAVLPAFLDFLSKK